MITIISYLFYFIAASSSPLQRRWLASRKNPDNAGQIHFSFQVTLVTVILSLVLPFLSPFYIHGNLYKLIELATVCGIFGSATYITSYVSQKYVEAGVSSVVTNIYTPITIILSTIFLYEGLTLLQVIGTLMLLIAMFIVSKKHRVGKFKFDKYFLLMLLSGIMLAFLLVAERSLIKTTGFTAGVIFSWWSTCLFLGIATFLTKNKSSYSKKDIAITGTLRFLQNVSWVTLVVVVGNLSIVSSITTFKVVIMFILGAIFLGEKEDLPRKIFGSIVAVVGLLLMG